MLQGLSFGVSLLTAPAVSFALGSQRIFCTFFLVLRAPALHHGPVVMSCVSLRLSSRCWLRLSLRTPSRSASPELWAPLVLVAPLLLPMLAHPQLRCHRSARSALGGALTQPRGRCVSVALRVSHGCFPSDSHSLPISCAAAQTCTASQFQHRLWLAWFGCSRGVGIGHGLGHQVVPTSPASPVAPFPRFSRSARCFSRLAAICRRLRALCTLSPGLRGPLCCGDRVQLR